MLVFMQVGYFASQAAGGMIEEPILYFWLMGQILALYMTIAIVMCHFLRKFCQDPDKEEDEEEEDETDKNPNG